ncbi:MAG: PEP-CTERM sorting domain-containing protein [bacterium]|nr:PEP-CTERM sorting domain-containing protein [bacterium]
MISSKVRSFIAASTLFFLPQLSYAVATDINGALSDRGGAFALGNVDARSYDGPGFDAFQPFNSFVGSEILAINSFTGGALGSRHEFFLLSEVAHYDGYMIPGVGDEFGVLDSNNDFATILPKEFRPGDSAVITQGANEELTLALKSPEGMFSSVDGDNADGAAHLLGKRVEKAGTVFIQHADLYGGSLTFDLQVGDIVLFIEDLLLSGNMLYGGMDTDSDYNDLVVVMRSEPLPEPATLFLLGAAGLLGAGAKRRKAAL